MQEMRNTQRGFTLIEVMMVVAIIGILAAVALPTYQDYTKRARVSEIVLAASSCRATISEVYQTGSSTPAANAWGCESSSQATRYVASIATDANGVITVTAAAAFGGDKGIEGQSIDLIPLSAANTQARATGVGTTTIFAWVCQPTVLSGGFNPKYLPGSCRNNFAKS